MADIDPRLLRVSIDVDREIRRYDQLAIVAQGVKAANPNQGECEVSITNLERSVRDYLLTETSPFNNNRGQKRIMVEAGRQSTGYSLLYEGTIFRATVSQPPDQRISIKCLTGQFQKSNIVVNSISGNVPLSEIAAQVARDIGTGLIFEATERLISDYSFTGSATRQVDKLDEVPGVNVYVDNRNLVVKNDNTPLSGRTLLLTPDNGLIGIPEPTEFGLRITSLYDNRIALGGMIELRTRRYPSLSGRYVIYQLNYHLTNRDTPFYLVSETRRSDARSRL